MKKLIVCLLGGVGAWGALAFELGLDMNGNVRLGTGGVQMGTTIYHENWNGSSSGLNKTWSFPVEGLNTAHFTHETSERTLAEGRTTLVPMADGRAFLSVTMTSQADQKPECVCLSFSCDVAALVGRAWSASSGKKGTFPKNREGQTVFSGTVDSFTFDDPGTGKPFTLTFTRPMTVLLQDDRQWTPTFTVRISLPGAQTFPKGSTRVFNCFLSTGEAMSVTVDKPVVVSRGADWIPLDYGKDIEAGSALDFSNMGLLDAPAGKHGWLRNVNGHFEFEKLPGKPQRFYGVNLCFSANFPDEQDAERIVTRLARLGYNAVRIHHYENWGGTISAKDRISLDSGQMRKLDKLLALCVAKGLYITTDLFTSRPVMYRDIGLDMDGRVPQQVYKNLVGVHAPAFENWKTFARNFLTHTNAFTGRRYIDEPALPLISLINEGQLPWCWDAIRHLAPMKAAWKAWLAKRRAADPAFAKGVSDDAAQNAGWGNAAVMAFMADTEADLACRERAFLESIGLKAMLTSENCGPHTPDMQVMRSTCYDYVDDHFYVDHPHFLGKEWQLPSSCGNGNPVTSDSLPLLACAFTRLADKPFTITEWNFSGPGMFRGVGGIMTGAMGALQNWDGLWRFSYAHSAEGLRDRSGFPGYFDVGSDPLGQASDRASICLFLRGDMPSLAGRLAVDVTDATGVPADNRSHDVVPAWKAAAWELQVATTARPVKDVPAVKLGATRWGKKSPVAGSPTTALRLDRESGSFRIDTPRTAGGFTPQGRLVAGPVSFDVGNVAATVWASSLDGAPIASSSRLLVTHLTDVQADGNVYADAAKKILLKWGAYPPVVRNGAAEIALTLDDPAAYEVWALETTGRRAERMASAVRGGALTFTATVKGTKGARMLYEVCRPQRAVCN